MTTESLCPLCKRGAQKRHLQSSGAVRVTCDTCGKYDIDDNIYNRDGNDKFEYAQGARFGDIAYLLSALTRQAYEAGNRIAIVDNISTLLESNAIPKSALEKMDLALVYVSERQTKADDEPQVHYDNDYPLIFAKDGDEFGYILNTLVERELLHSRGEYNKNRRNQFYRLTPEGWEKVEQIRKTQVNSNQAFVAMSFSDSMLKAWDEGFKPALESMKYNPTRVDLEEFEGKIDDYIIAQIRRSGLLVADFTEQSGGVYFEAGFAMGLGIPVIWTCRDTDIKKLHFDTRQFNHIKWSGSQDLRERLQNRIAAMIPGRILAN